MVSAKFDCRLEQPGAKIGPPLHLSAKRLGEDVQSNTQDALEGPSNIQDAVKSPPM